MEYYHTHNPGHCLSYYMGGTQSWGWHEGIPYWVTEILVTPLQYFHYFYVSFRSMILVKNNLRRASYLEESVFRIDTAYALHAEGPRSYLLMKSKDISKGQSSRLCHHILNPFPAQEIWHGSPHICACIWEDPLGLSGDSLKLPYPE